MASGRLRLKNGDIAVFLLSLALAFGAWMVTNLSRNYSSIVSIPVNAHSSLDGHSCDASSSVEISARCRTTGFNILKRRRSDAPVDVWFQASDFHHRSGEVFYVTSSELSAYAEQIFGNGVTIETFLQQSVEFSFPFENHKKVPVQPVQSISCKSQYTLTGPLKIQPDSVTLYGEPLYLDNIDRVYTSLISLSGLSQPFRGTAQISIPANVRCGVAEVNYSADVVRYVDVRTTVDIGVRNVPSGRSLSVFPSRAEVIFRCSFPLGVNPTHGLSFWIDYNDFLSSIGGRCIPHVSGLSGRIIDYRIEPEVFECLESSGL